MIIAMMLPRRSATLAMLALLGCTDKDVHNGFSVKWVRDYTDIPIIHNDAGVPGSRSILSAVPYTRINDASGGDLSVISRVSRLSTGEIVILDNLNRSIVLFSSSGEVIRTIGRVGDGPGEVRRLRGLLVLPGDTLVGFTLPGRLIRWLPDGSFVREQPVPRPPPVQRDAGGRVELIHTSSMSQPLRNGAVYTEIQEPASLQMGYSRDLVLHALVHPGQQLIVDTIGWFPARRQNRLNEDEVRVDYLSPQTSVAIGAAYLYIGDGATYEIGQYDLKGRLLRRIRRDGKALAVSLKDRRAYEAVLPKAGARGVAGYEVGDTYAFFYGLAVDDRDQVWVQQPHPDNRHWQLWAVFDTAGRLIEEVTMPFSHRVAWIDSTTVYAVAQDTITMTPELLMFSRQPSSRAAR